MATKTVLTTVLTTSLVAASCATAREVPSNVRDFVNSVRGKGQCDNVLAGGFFTSWDDTVGAGTYCGDHVADYNVLYIQGTGGDLADMDIDCDGIQNGPADDGRCESSDDTQSITSFQYLVEGYGTGQRDLDANAHPYVVFGNTGSKPGWPTFDPRAYGVEPLSVMAVVCGDKLVYGVWGDMNGDDGDHAMVGETSLALATACYGEGMNGNNGHSEKDVMYIAFPGKDAVPGASGARWNAQNFDDFEASIAALGDRLVQRLGCDDCGGGEEPQPQPPSEGDQCSWPGHCAGAPCGTWDDCADELTCTNGKCAPP